MVNNLVVLGAGGQGRETLALLRELAASGATVPNLLGVLARDRTIGVELPARYLGSPDSQDVLDSLPEGCGFSLAIGSSSIRDSYRRQLIAIGFHEVLLVHPSVVVGENVALTTGTVAAGSVITTDVSIGSSVQINIGCTISHDVTFGDSVTLAPGVNVCGGVVIGSRSTVYANATLLPGVQIGEDATVGAGSVVIKDVPAGATVAGVPAGPLPRG